MFKKYVFVFLCFAVCNSFSQNVAVDSTYLEDQFYIGVTYNTFRDKLSNMTQRNLPYGLQLGFIKDMPINDKRTVAIGLGLGYAVNSYYSNLIATKSNDDITYAFLANDVSFQRSKIETHIVELPIEFRWRMSTPTNYKFLRIYGGVKLGYAFASRSKFVSNDKRESFYNTDISKFRYGLQFNMGYNTWNVHIYYGLNNLINTTETVAGESINIKPLRIGFIFYIL
ncbi:PorT family protein [Cellulophaga sp. F20128]|uniref:porin family protein n=1 Tax=Cellulophaga sp. F20128 TaxID=2926413 RepID=UPI001FF14465|nr:porin family protein [Cellulophaga sp. F20128]MCK0155608.1 PorT family protein [Cellulophaga sp. F20128]